VGNLSLLTTGDYYYHRSQIEMVERKWWPGKNMVWVLVGVTGCVSRSQGIAWLYCFPCLCRLKTIYCMDPGQVIDLLSRAHTSLWEREGLLLSCHGSGSFRTDCLEAGIGYSWPTGRNVTSRHGTGPARHGTCRAVMGHRAWPCFVPGLWPKHGPVGYFSCRAGP
jgi:hypothetical protein